LAGLILNVPYGSPFVPKAIHKRLTLTEDELRWENWHLTDPFLLDLVKKAAQPDIKPAPASRDLVKPPPDNNFSSRLLVVSYPYSPLVADPLGLLALELGQVKSPEPCILKRATQEKALPDWSPDERDFIFSRCVGPYIDELVKSARDLLATENLVILVNIRFFSHRPWLHQARPPLPTPQISLSLEESRTPKGLIHLLGHIFKTFGLWTELDFPLAGTAVPQPLQALKRLKVLGLGLRRDLYLDEDKGAPKSSAESLSRVLKNVFGLLGQELDRVAQIRIRRAFPPKPPSSIIKAGKLPETQS
jgi:hypothetical protein